MVTWARTWVGVGKEKEGVFMSAFLLPDAGSDRSRTVFGMVGKS